MDVVRTATDDLRGLWRMARLKASGAGARAHLGAGGLFLLG
ncbi:hypothetical protein AB0C96_39320 [Streptomyces sp. NPDC048506]